jgi:glycosyltransferase involved in cell wall biosynthesis
MNAKDVTVIISTYNQPEWLQKVLWSYEVQTHANFEIIIADDGSTQETKAIIKKFQDESSLKIVHVWHEDNGFQKTKILNKAILASNSGYLIFTDGDCIARQDFVSTHLHYQKPNLALSAGYYKLTEAISKSISKEDIVKQNCFNSQWLLAKGQPKNFKINKLTYSKFKAWFLNTFSPTKATFDGMNVSVWKQDILKVNGFDERMEYGGEDRELGERLVNNGMTFKQIRYSAICVHLHHNRPYKNDTSEIKNKQIRKQTKQLKSVYTKFGINK